MSERIRHVDLGGETPASARHNPLIVFVDGRRMEYSPSELSGIDPQQLFSRQQRVVVVIGNLYAWSVDERQAVFRFIVAMGRGIPVRSSMEDESEDRGLLRTILTMLENGNSRAARNSQGREAAIEAAVLAHPHGLQAACRLIFDRLVALGIDETLESLAQEAREVREALTEGDFDPDAEVSLVERLIDVPLPDAARVPADWSVSMEGVWGNQRVLRTPLLITRRLVDIHDGTESLEVAWWRDGQWQRRIVSARTVATGRITELATYGVPVIGPNAGNVTQFLDDFMSANEHLIPRDWVTRQFGWHGERGYMLGRDFYPTRRTAGDSMAAPTNLLFQGRSDGEDQLADLIRSAGTFEEWQRAVASVSQFPRVMFGLLGAFGAVLLDVVKSPSFVISFAGDTSTGKTTVLRLCASLFGIPDEHEPQTIIHTFDSTSLGLEQRVAAQSGIAMLIDDTKTADSVKEIGKLIYKVASGQSRGRGSVRGAESVDRFRTVLIMTGEAPTSSFSRDGGAQARTLEIKRLPFEDTHASIAQLFADVNGRLCANYGHAGPRFVQWLCEHFPDRERFQRRYSELCRRYRQLAGDNSVAGRKAQYFALLHLTAEVTVEAGILPVDEESAVASVEVMWDELTEGTQDAGGAADALRLMWNLFVRNESRFERDGRNISVPSFWGRTGLVANEVEVVAFIPEVVTHELERRGFNPEAAFTQWENREWIMSSPNRGRHRRMRVHNRLMDLIAIRLDAMENLTSGDEPAETGVQPDGSSESADPQIDDPAGDVAVGTDGTPGGTPHLTAV